MDHCIPVFLTGLEQIYQRQGRPLQISCVDAASSKENDELHSLYWYKGEEEIVVWDRATDTAHLMGGVSTHTVQ